MPDRESPSQETGPGTCTEVSGGHDDYHCRAVSVFVLRLCESGCYSYYCRVEFALNVHVYAWFTKMAATEVRLTSDL